MTMQATAWATSLRGVSPLAKLIAIALSENDHDAGHVNVEIAYLCDYCNATKEAVLQAIDELPDVGWVDQDGRIDCDLLAIKYAKPRPREARLAPDQSPCVIYVMTAKGRTKIGISHNPSRRREELQMAASEEVRLVWTAEKMPRFMARKIEQASHVRLAEFCVGGEWFSVSALVAIDVVRTEMELHGNSP
jgi:hypothetical protein